MSSNYTVITGLARPLSEFETFPRFEIDTFVQPPFVPGPELGRVLNIGGVTINHVASTDQRTHLIVRSPDGTRSSSDERMIALAVNRLRDYLNESANPVALADLTSDFRDKQIS